MPGGQLEWYNLQQRESDQTQESDFRFFLSMSCANETTQTAYFKASNIESLYSPCRKSSNKEVFKLLFLLHLFFKKLSVCTWECTMTRVEAEDKSWKLVLSSDYMDSGHQVWWQVPLSTELSH